jgi:hypothetical protein
MKRDIEGRLIGSLHGITAVSTPRTTAQNPLRSRSGRNNAELSVERPLLLRAEVVLATDTSGHAQEIVASPETNGIIPSRSTTQGMIAGGCKQMCPPNWQTSAHSPDPEGPPIS